MPKARQKATTESSATCRLRNMRTSTTGCSARSSAKGQAVAATMPIAVEISVGAEVQPQLGPWDSASVIPIRLVESSVNGSSGNPSPVGAVRSAGISTQPATPSVAAATPSPQPECRAGGRDRPRRHSGESHGRKQHGDQKSDAAPCALVAGVVAQDADH